jgi:recombination protein RecA
MARKKIEEKEKINLAEAISEIRDKFGEGAIMKLKDAQKANVDVVPTGSLSIDLALGVMGVPRGRIIEIYGGESTGKTTLS